MNVGKNQRKKTISVHVLFHGDNTTWKWAENYRSGLWGILIVAEHAPQSSAGVARENSWE